MRIEQSEKSNIYSMLLMLLFVLLIYFLADFVVMRDLDRNIELKSRLKMQETITKFMKENKKRLDDELANFFEVAPYYDNLSKKFDLKKMFGSYGQLIKMEKVFEKEKKDLHQQRFLVTLRIDSPTKLYALIQKIQKEALPLRLGQPVRFEKVGSKIETTFILDRYSFAR